jgi:catechol 2,3-dioxygenase-like lactoylglutathione lyase family enzyme
MKRVTGIGGIFFKTQDPQATKYWYAKHLGFNTDQWGATFKTKQWDDPTKSSYLQWSPFKHDTDYFEPSIKEFMVNYRVHDLEALVTLLKEEGVTICDEIASYDYGKFVHIMDGDGNKIELWEPKDEVFDQM